MNRAIGDLIPGGRTFSSIKLKGDYDPVKTACVSFGTLKNTITRWIVDVYHHTHHRGIDTTPYLKWNTSIDPEDIPLPAKPHELDAITGNFDTRKIWNYGIEINNLV